MIESQVYTLIADIIVEVSAAHLTECGPRADDNAGEVAMRLQESRKLLTSASITIFGLFASTDLGGVTIIGDLLR